MDRRTLWAILLMMVIAIAPAIFLKKPVPTRKGAGPRASATPAPTSSSGEPRTPPAADTTSAVGVSRDSAGRPAGGPPSTRTIHVTSPLYEYGISSTGA